MSNQCFYYNSRFCDTTRLFLNEKRSIHFTKHVNKYVCDKIIGKWVNLRDCRSVKVSENIRSARKSRDYVKIAATRNARRAF